MMRFFVVVATQESRICGLRDKFYVTMYSLVECVGSSSSAVTPFLFPLGADGSF